MVAPPKFKVRVVGDLALSRRLGRISGNAVDLSDEMREIGRHLDDLIERQFATQGREFGTPWDPLEPSTIERKGSSEILVETGAMLRSRGVKSATRSELVYELDDRKTAFHQGRDRSASNPVPRRPVFEPTDAVRDYMMDVLQRGVFGRANASGR